MGSRASETLGQVEHRQEPGWPDLGAVWREPQRWPGTYIDLWNLGGVTTRQQGARSRAHGWARLRGQCTTQDGCKDDQTVGPGPSVAPTYSWPTSKADPPSWPALILDSSLSPAKLPAHRRHTSQINSNRFKALNFLLYFILFRYFFFDMLGLHCCVGFL